MRPQAYLGRGWHAKGARGCPLVKLQDYGVALPSRAQPVVSYTSPLNIWLQVEVVFEVHCWVTVKSLIYHKYLIMQPILITKCASLPKHFPGFSLLLQKTTTFQFFVGHPCKKFSDFPCFSRVSAENISLGIRATFLPFGRKSIIAGCRGCPGGRGFSTKDDVGIRPHSTSALPHTYQVLLTFVPSPLESDPR